MVAGKADEPMSLNRMSVERTTDQDLVITRSFRAPAAIVFDAWTKPEFVKRWWAPASRATVVECVADVRPGGTYRYVLAPKQGGLIAFFGRYLEMARPTRLVYTQGFEPVLGKPMPGEAVITVSFEERDGSTTLVSREHYPSKAVLDSVIGSGMEVGAREAFDQLEALVVSLAG